MATLRSRTISVAIDRAPADVYAYVYDAANMPRWATAFVRAIRQDGDGWIVETPDGVMPLRFVPRNELGVLDHTVTVSPGQDVLNPMRVVPNGGGSEVLFTVFQLPGMSDERFAVDCGYVQHDLRALKTVLEGAG
jgi:hypothetical protein